MGTACGAGKLSVSGGKKKTRGKDLLCSTSSLHLEANPYKSCHNCFLCKKKKKEVESWCLCCLFLPEHGVYFPILLPCRWRNSLCTENSLSFAPRSLCLPEWNCMKFLNQIFPGNVKSSPSLLFLCLHKNIYFFFFLEADKQLVKFTAAIPNSTVLIMWGRS